MQPVEQTMPIHKPEGTYLGIGRPVQEYESEDITVFTDGSGGRSSSDGCAQSQDQIEMRNMGREAPLGASRRFLGLN